LIAMQIAEETPAMLPRMTGLAGTLQKAEQWLGSTVAAAAALLVVAEIVVLFSGVSARYLFQRPLIWSDELPESSSYGWRCWVPSPPSSAASTCG
jgi:hypothetical protein